GLVICSARTFTRDYDETVQYWGEQGVPVWGTIPERVAIASGPDRSLSPDGIEAYRPLWRRVVRATRGEWRAGAGGARAGARLISKCGRSRRRSAPRSSASTRESRSTPT